MLDSYLIYYDGLYEPKQICIFHVMVRAWFSLHMGFTSVSQWISILNVYGFCMMHFTWRFGFTSVAIYVRCCVHVHVVHWSRINSYSVSTAEIRSTFLNSCVEHPPLISRLNTRQPLLRININSWAVMFNNTTVSWSLQIYCVNSLVRSGSYVRTYPQICPCH